MASTKNTAVLWSVAQNLETGDQSRARTNIGLGSAAVKDAPTSGVDATTTQVVMGDDTRLTDSRNPLSHAHGYIQNGGTFSTESGASATIGNDDTLLIVDSSDSSKIKKTSIKFSSTSSNSTKYLSQTGSWETLPSYTTGIDLTMSGTQVAVNTNSTLDSNSTTNYSFVIGNSNSITTSKAAFAGGNSNTITDANYATAVGLQNKIYSGAVETMAGGYNNRIYYADDSFVYGYSNTLGMSGSSSLLGTADVIFGYSNTLQGGNYNAILGSDNKISGALGSSPIFPNNVMMFGHHLEWVDFNTSPMVAGKYNATAIHDMSLEPIRVTGGGTSTSSRKNIEELTSNGVLWVDNGFETSYYNGSEDYVEFTVRSDYGRIQSLHRVSATVTSGDKVMEEFSYSDSRAITVGEVTNVNNSTTSMHFANLYSFRREKTTQHEDLDYNRQCALEFNTNGGNIGLAPCITPYIPSWNGTQAQANTLTANWFEIYAERAGDDNKGNVLPSVKKEGTTTLCKTGNLAVGKLAVEFFNASTLTSTYPLLPSARVGELAFIYADQDNIDFWVKDNHDPAAGAAGSIKQCSGYVSANSFCVLMTVTPTMYNAQGGITKIGGFACLTTGNH